MKTINFEQFEFFLNIEKTEKVTEDVRSQLANAIYVGANGIEMHALALKIYNSKGATEYSDKECELLVNISLHLAPMFIDAVENVLK